MRFSSTQTLKLSLPVGTDPDIISALTLHVHPCSGTIKTNLLLKQEKTCTQRFFIREVKPASGFMQLLLNITDSLKTSSQCTRIIFTDVCSRLQSHGSPESCQTFSRAYAHYDLFHVRQWTEITAQKNSFISSIFWIHAQLQGCK